MFFSVHLLFNIYYISATFPHKLRKLSRTNYANFPAQITLLLLHVGNRMCYNINVAFFVPFRDIEKGKVFCRAILIIIRLEIVCSSRKAAEGKF